jgi:quinol monooxygenase YgiN
LVARRNFVSGAVAMAVAGAFAGTAGAAMGGGDSTYGMIGRLKAKPGQRAALAAILAQATGEMAGCLSYVVAEDLADGDALWVTEIWKNKAAHDASLSLPAVREAISKGSPLIAGFDHSAQTRPISGVPSRS